MSGALFGLTSYEEVKAQLGASVTDFSDQDLDDLAVDKELRLDLLIWFPSYQSLVDDVTNDTVIQSQKLALETYAKVFCAYKVSAIAPMKFLQKRANGDDQAARFQSKNAISDFQAALRGKTVEYKKLVLSFSTAYTPTISTLSVNSVGIGISKPTDTIVRP